MMRRRYLLIVVLVILGSGVAAFCIGRIVRADRHQAQAGWLRGASVNTVRAEQQFQQRTRQLAEAVQVERDRLSLMLADPDSADEQIIAQTENVVTSHARLMDAVGGHLVELRGTLPRGQQRCLMELCVDSLQGQVRRRYRRRGAFGDDTNWPGWGNGYGGGHGQGPRGGGRGRGRQYAAGQGSVHGLAGRLGLTAEQAAMAQQRDPDFDADCDDLKDRLSRTHADLLASFQRADVSDTELLNHVAALIEAHAGLERRVARHVVLLRPLLTQAQRERLAGLCGGTGRFRGGGPASWRQGNVGQLAWALWLEPFIDV